MRKNIGVFCGSNDGNKPVYADTAYEFGQRLAAQGYGLVYGAGGRGIMGAVSNGALSENGVVHGYIPHDMIKKEWGRTDLTNLCAVSDIQERQKRMYEASAATVTLPGGFGTLVEFFESLTWSQIGYHNGLKPSYILNVDGYFDELVEMLAKIIRCKFARPDDRELYAVFDSIDDLMHELTTTIPTT